MRCVCCIVLLLNCLNLYGEDMTVTNLNLACEENFNNFAGTMTTLPAGMGVSIDGTNVIAVTNDFRGISDGGEVTGGCYAWDTGEGDMALGCQPTESKFSPGFFIAIVSNGTGTGINEISVSYDVVCLNNADRSSSLAFEVSLDGVSFRRMDEMTFVSPAGQSDVSAWVRTTYSRDLCLENKLMDGQQIWLRWYLDDAGGSSSRDEYGIDNLRIVFHHRAGTVIAIY